jgi:flavodoxin/Pyruvate/2-oxoacid:ferredoxin oxidoreductase delta subunit
MKGIVVYYSATGNTQKVAKAIQTGMKKILDQCDIGSIKKLDPKKMSEYDVIAIGGPLWYWREPSHLKLFAYNMPGMDGKLCILFCCHGSTPCGFFYSFAPALLKKGLKIIGWKDWYSSMYQVLHLPYPYLTHGHPDEVDLKEAEEFGKEMAQNAARIKAGETNLVPEVPKGPEADWLWRPYVIDGEGHVPGTEPGNAGRGTNILSEDHPRRKINKSKCRYPDCTICMDNCPMAAFDVSQNPPEVTRRCKECSLCELICPNDAIELNGAGVVYLPELKRIDMTKCKYPGCTVCIDNCNNDSIDFSRNPPVFKNNCERDDLCWLICPEGAIEITNLEETHGTLKMLRSQQGLYQYPHGLLQQTIDAEKAGKFRRLTPIDDVGWENLIMYIKDHPRFDIKELKDEE